MTSRSNGQRPTSNADWSFDLLLDEMWLDELAWHCGVDLCLLACEAKLVEWAWKHDLVSRLVRQQTDNWRYESWTSEGVMTLWLWPICQLPRQDSEERPTQLLALCQAQLLMGSCTWSSIHSSRHKMPSKNFDRYCFMMIMWALKLRVSRQVTFVKWSCSKLG